jgi:tetratricopeptide (TPR) repeat protein
MDVNQHIQRATLLMNTNRYDDAVKELNAALALEPHNIQALGLASVCYYNMGQYDRSMAFTRQWLGAEPDNPRAHYILALNYWQAEKKDNAKQHIGQAITLDPYDADYWSTLASFYMAEREWAKVLEFADKGLSCDPEHAESLNYRNLALTKLGRTQELNAGIEETLAAHPDSAHTHATVGWAKLETRNYKEARFHFSEALRLQPHNNWARSGMVEALKAKNVFYRLFLMYFFWIAKHKNQSQWGIIIVFYIGTRLLGKAAQSYSLLYIPYGILVFLAYLTWITEPLFNVVVLLDRYGRYLLNRREKTGAILVGSGVLAALLLAAAYFATNNDFFILPAVYFASIVIPTASYYGLDNDGSRNVKIIGAYTAVLAILGIAALGIFYSSGNAILGIVYIIGVWTFGWVANFLNSR